MKMKINTNSQLELGIQNPAPCRSHPVTRHAPLVTFRWWFNRMRQVVERATGWNPAPAPRPEQTWFPNATRSVTISHR